jgi:hypothetical protein
MKKVALLGLCLVALLLLTPVIYFLSETLSGGHPMPELGLIVAFAPPIATAAVSMYAIHRVLFSERLSRAGRIAFYVLSLAASLLLMVGGFMLAALIQIAVFGE